jgi:hypothetical protein
MNAARNERLQRALAALLVNKTMAANDLRLAMGLESPDHSPNALLKLADSGWIQRQARGFYSLGPKAFPVELSDAWLVLQQLKHGPLTLDWVVDLLDCEHDRSVATAAAGDLVARALARADGDLLELACDAEVVP